MPMYIEGAYDVVSSIGQKCQPAGRLKRAGLRKFSGPFDWFARQLLAEVEYIFTNGVDRVFQDKNVSIVGKFDGVNAHCLKVQDSATKFLSIHDYPVTLPSTEFHEFNSQFMKKIGRRYNRLINEMQNADKVLLVRINATKKGVSKLAKTLNKIFPATHIDYLILNEDQNCKDITRVDWGQSNIYSYIHHNSPTGPGWLGSDELWDKMLGGVRLHSAP